MWFTWIINNWRIFAIAIILLAMAIGLGRYGHARYVAGHLAGAREQLDADAKQYGAEIAARDAALKAASAQEAEFTRQMSESAQMVAKLSARIKNLAQESLDAHAIVSKIPDNLLFSDIRHKLGLVDAILPEPFTPGEMREIDQRVTQHPILIRQVTSLTDQTAALSNQLKATEGQRDSIKEEREAWKDFAARVQAHYVACYNAFPRHRNWPLTIVTFGLKGKPRHLDLPKPGDLRP